MKSAHSAFSKEEMLIAIEEQVVHHMPSYGSLFALSSRDYDKLMTDSGVKELIVRTYQWLGSKPPKLQVTSSPDLTPSKHVFVISKYDHDHPYVLAAHAVMFALRNTLEKRMGTTITDDLVEIASVQTGLGLIILNALVSPDTALHLWRHGKNSGSHQSYHLQTMTITAYAAELAAYGHAHTIRAQTLLAGLHKATHRYLPDYYTHHQVAPLAAPNIIRTRQRMVHTALIRVTLVAVLFSLVTCIGLYLAAQRPYQPSPETTEQYNKIQSLQYQYNYCKKYLQEQQNNYNQSDITTESNLASLAAECDSLKNQYNYQISTYNEHISE